MVNDELSLLRLYSEEHIIRQGYVMANELFFKNSQILQEVLTFSY